MAESRELKLPLSGQTVLVSNRRLKVKDNDRAFALVGDLKRPMALMAARAALVCTYPDGRPVLFEEILEWYEEDLEAVTKLRDDADFLETVARP
jgi:hypothetical protein